MASDFKQCPNGHYYSVKLATCPYCKSSTNATTVSYENPTSGPTVSKNPTSGPTQVYDNIGETIPNSDVSKVPDNNRSYNPNCKSTEFWDRGDVHPIGRTNRKLVGWLVTYSLDPMGVDFKLYEGRNIIGRDMGCNITVNDNYVSSKHAVLLFRVDKFSITDQQSSHGTFVNGEDIELEPKYLEDGDRIKIGRTEFLFRKSF